MTATASALTNLKSQRPEWAPWLAVVEEVLRNADGRTWEAAVPAVAHVPESTVPFLAGAKIVMAPAALGGLLRRLIDVACRGGTAQMSSLRSTRNSDVDLFDLFKASLCQDSGRIAAMAASHGADPGAFEAIVAMIAVPFLHACNRQWARSIPASWREGYCCVCGSWPSFAEVRGIERNRVFRCGRCGGGWNARPLRCPYCDVDDHNALVSLVPQGSDANAVIEGCKSCLGYVKTFTRLQGCAPGMVMFDDLASVHLDVAALEQGYLRRQGLGYPLDLTIVPDSHGQSH